MASNPDNPKRHSVTVHGTGGLPATARRLLKRQLSLACMAAAPDATVTLVLHLVRDRRMTAVNEHFLGHLGTTDVITFDTSGWQPPSPHGPPPADAGSTPIHIEGELFLCVDEARRAAAARHLPLDSELLRYAIHGLLHLIGYDDKQPEDRRRMKRREDLLVRQFARERRTRARSSRHASAGLARPPAATTPGRRARRGHAT